METKYITIPFDVEKAKRITSGVDPGNIVTRDGISVRVLCFDRKGNYPIISLMYIGDKHETILQNGIDGKDNPFDDKESKLDLLLSVPEWATFKDGDIIYCEVDNGDSGVCKWVSILKGKVECFSGDLYTDEYATCIIESNTCKGEMSFDGYADNIDTIVLANESQKQYIIEAIKESKDPKAEGYLKRFFPNHSNSLSIGKEYKFEPFDKVLVRDDNNAWLPSFFSHKTEGNIFNFFTTSGRSWKYCIPYNDQTSHLLGTTDAWEG